MYLKGTYFFIRISGRRVLVLQFIVNGLALGIKEFEGTCCLAISRCLKLIRSVNSRQSAKDHFLLEIIEIQTGMEKQSCVEAEVKISVAHFSNQAVYTQYLRPGAHVGFRVGFRCSTVLIHPLVLLHRARFTSLTSSRRWRSSTWDSTARRHAAMRGQVAFNTVNASINKCTGKSSEERHSCARATPLKCQTHTLVILLTKELKDDQYHELHDHMNAAANHK